MMGEGQQQQPTFPGRFADGVSSNSCSCQVGSAAGDGASNLGREGMSCLCKITGLYKRLQRTQTALLTCAVPEFTEKCWRGDGDCRLRARCPHS